MLSIFWHNLTTGTPHPLWTLAFIVWVLAAAVLLPTAIYEWSNPVDDEEDDDEYYC